MFVLFIFDFFFFYMFDVRLFFFDLFLIIGVECIGLVGCNGCGKFFLL